MARAKKEGVFVNCKMDAAIAEKLKSYCDETGISKTLVIEKAIALYLSNPDDSAWGRLRAKEYEKRS